MTIDFGKIGELAIANGYVAVTGPFTTAEMAETNTRALFQALDAGGVVNAMLATLDEVLVDQSIVGGDEMLCIRVGDKHASYDRWGFVGGFKGVDEEDMDQVDLMCIIIFLCNDLKDAERKAEKNA